MVSKQEERLSSSTYRDGRVVSDSSIVCNHHVFGTRHGFCECLGTRYSSEYSFFLGSRRIVGRFYRGELGNGLFWCSMRTCHPMGQSSPSVSKNMEGHYAKLTLCEGSQ